MNIVIYDIAHRPGPMVQQIFLTLDVGCTTVRVILILFSTSTTSLIDNEHFLDYFK